MAEWGIPELRVEKLCDRVPTAVYAGATVADPAQPLFIWRTHALKRARAMVVGFYTDDYRFEALWRHPERHTAQFLAARVSALVEPDFSLWADAPLVEQLWNVYRMRTLGRLYQEHGLRIIPNLAWSDERSFEFAFSGIPRGCPVVATEARTAGQNDDDRRRFLAGLAEGIRR